LFSIITLQIMIVKNSTVITEGLFMFYPLSLICCLYPNKFAEWMETRSCQGSIFATNFNG